MQSNAINLQDRTAVVTGGAQGIGFAIAERLLRSGARVALWDVDRDRLVSARADLEVRTGQPVPGYEVNIADHTGVAATAEQTAADLGWIDILVNNAAIVGPNATVVEYPVEHWQRVIDVDVNGTFYCCRAVLPYMIARNYGRIVNVASIAGKEGNPNAAAYSAAKAAVIALTKSLGKEVAHLDIGVNCVTPAVARTPGAMAQAPEHIEYMLAKIPRGRFLELHEAAAMIAWLVSEENAFTTGAVFDLSGGRATY
jgi:3-oxoacyl-[acyl-carrier protein] reductase